MQIDFFFQPCKSDSSSAKFGLCDDPDPAKNPAYIDEADSTKWIATVDNPNLKVAEFYAIDNCLNILDEAGAMQSRCDGMLSYENKVIFIELKDRNYKNWLGGGRDQLIQTITTYAANYPVNSLSAISGVVANCQRPKSNGNYAIHIQKFNDEMELLGIPAELTISPFIKI